MRIPGKASRHHLPVRRRQALAGNRRSASRLCAQCHLRQRPPTVVEQLQATHEETTTLKTDLAEALLKLADLEDELFVLRDYGSSLAQFDQETIALKEELQAKNIELSVANNQLEALATTDPLTGLPNHRMLVETLDQEIERSRRFGRSFSLLFLDLDHFKALNDTCGHQAGDTALSEFTAVVRNILRTIDVVGRWGGEEFLAVLPETDSEGARVAAERVRCAVAAHAFSPGGGMSLTCSLGLATFPLDAQVRDELVDAADRAMYAAKQMGRNQFRSASDPEVAALGESSRKTETRDDVALLGAVEALGALATARGCFSDQHTRKVAHLAVSLASRLGFDDLSVRMVEMAAVLHDIGMIALPDAVLQKSTKLTVEEWALVHQHPIIGAEVVSRLPSLRALAPIIRAHHERWDGHGYPDELAGDAIPIGARIIAVAGAFSAMTGDRPYQRGQSAGGALQELQRSAGAQFDPAVVKAFAGVLNDAGVLDATEPAA